MHGVEYVLDLHHTLLPERLYFTLGLIPRKPYHALRLGLCFAMSLWLQQQTAEPSGSRSVEQVRGAENPLATFGRFVLCSGAVGQHPSAGHQGLSWCFHFIQKKTKRLKQSSGSKEHCGKPHFLSELLPHYGCDPQMQLIREMKPVEKEKPLSDAQTQC